MDTLTMQSFAKVNVGLQIRNKRQDGFHNIHTVFQELNLHDIIVLKLKDSDCEFTSNVDWLNNDLSNLCVSAWKRLKGLFNIGGISKLSKERLLDELKKILNPEILEKLNRDKISKDFDSDIKKIKDLSSASVFLILIILVFLIILSFFL